MSIEQESLTVKTRPGDNTGIGITIFSVDNAGGAVVGATIPLKHGATAATSRVYHDRHIENILILSNTVDYPFFIIDEGIWVVDNVMSIRRVVGSDAGAVTADIMAVASGTAPASGTTQLSAADSINLKSPAADIIANHALATTLTEVGPGSYFGLNVGGTLTAVVANLTVEFRRVR